MRYGTTITYFEKKDGMLIPHTESFIGSKTTIFNHISEILHEGNFENLTVMVNRPKS